ncbi:MAG: hypothetical protein H7203_15955, partial [Rhizobacter sp.]|nr:hypothetical protein [Burkholderiales bacterium]
MNSSHSLPLPATSPKRTTHGHSMARVDVGASMTHTNNVTRALRAVSNAMRSLSGDGSAMKAAENGSRKNRQIGVGAWSVGLALALGAAHSAQ